VFCAVFGAIAGDLALTLGAWDGVFLTGGLVPKMLAELQASDFRRRFKAKGRFAGAMARVPTVAVLHPQAGLLGAAAFARQDAHA
jgi:glucokinase